jgi:cobaltochelatase CobN
MTSGHGSAAKATLIKSLSTDLEFDLVNYSTKGKSEEQINERWKSAELIMLDGINPMLTKYMFGNLTKYIKANPSIPVIALGDLNHKELNNGLSEQKKQIIATYFKNAGRENYRNLMLYLADEMFNLAQYDYGKPYPVPNVGLYHYDYKTDTEKQVTDNENGFFNWLNAGDSQPIIAIGIHRSVVDYEQQQVVDALIKGLEAKGAKAFGFFFEGNDESLTYPELLIDDNGKPHVDLLINYRSLHYVEKRRAEFEQVGVPVIHALNYTEGDETQFRADNAGISPSLTPFFLVMPEDTGSTDPSIIAANSADKNKKGVKEVLKDELNALVERAYNHARLPHIANADKKVATFIWNYPPGEKNVGAAFLDVPSSIAQIVKEMKKQGYSVEEKDAEYLIEGAGKLLRPSYRQETRDEDLKDLIDTGLADYLPLITYSTWFYSLPEFVTQPIIEVYGKPEDNPMLVKMPNGEQGFVIPRMKLGNMVVLPQGMRGDTIQEHSANYHNMKKAINHGYLVQYLYVRETFGAHAYIHLGTHGSQEWLGGKERGLSAYDAPNLVIGNLPVFYPYIIDNVGEAMQAKRRGRATMISHLTPGFAKAGLYAEVAKLNELISNYVMLEQGQTQANTQAEIIKLADELNILKDVELDKTELETNFNTHIATLQDQLNGMAEQSQPLGVHTFGLLPKEAHLISTMLQMLGEDFTEAAGQYEQENGLAIAEADAFEKNGERKIEALLGFQFLKAHLAAQAQTQELEGLSESLKAQLVTADEYWLNFQNIAETQNLLRALNGEYIKVSHGGDPIRNPQAAPTGRNLIGFNPAKVPSKEAYEAGVTLMNQTIDDYYNKHGKYPDKLAFSLWSLETMRHQGALEAQVLHALGLKPKWNRAGNVTGTEVIPYSELGRPRVDVVISATGLYRDAFPNVMLWLAEAIDKVAKLKEENNFVYRHANKLKQDLLEQGKSEEDAEYLSTVRIFSNDTGEYGTGLAGQSLDSGSWEDDSELADTYLNRMGYGFGKDEKRWSESLGDINLYKQVLSGTDGVVFSRSTNLYALLTNDDPFQYFGGIGLAVRNIDGKTPEMYVANMRNKDKVKTQNMKEFLNQEMRSRYFHPRWIQAMQESGYAGATAILDRMNNMWGWEVMTPEAVRDDHWQEFFDVYVEDKYELEMREFFENANPTALAQILERMLEAVRKDYWQADQATIEKMIATYTDLANKFDVVTDNQKFNDYVNDSAVGFGLQPILSALPEVAAQAQANAANTQQVHGQKLEQVEQTSETEVDNTYKYMMIFGIAFIFFAGMLSNLGGVTRRDAIA